MVPENQSGSVIVGLETADDASVFKLDTGKVIVQTVDFFTPIVNDPYLFGQIAAANSLSDIYAMGAEPSYALSMVAFPCKIGMDILVKIVEGGLDKMKEAGVSIVGGHSVDDEEPKYGFSVTGFCAEEEIIRNSTAKPGNLIYLTKPVGTGILATAIKADMIKEEELTDYLAQVTKLNKYAKDAALAAKATALTDVTGFGVIGHLYEMAKASGLSAKIKASSVKLNKKALEFVDYGIMPAGLHENKKYVEDSFSADKGIDKIVLDMLFDPQTNGGLLISVAEENAGVLEGELSKRDEIFSRIGSFFDGEPGKIRASN